MRSLLFPTFLSRFEDAALLALRLFLGAFLIWGVWDNIVSAERMAEFEQFLARLNCPAPALAAPLSVWAQFAVGVALIAGLLSRWAGAVLAVNFVAAVALLAPTGAGPRDLYGPAILVFVGLLFAARGAGGLSAEGLLRLER